MALFERAGESFHPSELTTGPWRADAQHGGPPAALLTRHVEELVGEGESVARISVELVRPVPLDALTIEARRTPVSRRVAHIDADLRRGETTVATCRALVLAHTPLPTPVWAPDGPGPDWSVPPPETRVDPPSWASGTLPVTYHQHAVEHRMTRGTFGRPGPATSWVRLLVPLVAGEETSPLCRVMATADFGSGISSIFEPEQRAGLINADLTVALVRPPQGEWTVVQSETQAGPDGTGLCVSELGDEHGPIGVGTQTLLGLTF